MEREKAAGRFQWLRNQEWLTQIADHHVNHDHLVQSRNGWQSKVLVRRVRQTRNRRTTELLSSSVLQIKYSMLHLMEH